MSRDTTLCIAAFNVAWFPKGYRDWNLFEWAENEITGYDVPARPGAKIEEVISDCSSISTDMNVKQTLEENVIVWTYQSSVGGTNFDQGYDSALEVEIDGVGAEEVFEDFKDEMLPWFIYLLASHPDLTRSSLHPFKWTPPPLLKNPVPLEASTKPLFVRAYLVFDVTWSYDDYSGEADCLIEFKGLLDMDKLDTILVGKEETEDAATGE